MLIREDYNFDKLQIFSGIQSVGKVLPSEFYPCGVTFELG